METPKTNILNAASTLFLKGGVAALSVRAIADLAGVSTIGIYSHFQGKQGILDALYIEGFNQVSAAMDVLGEGLKIELKPPAAVLKACENYLASAENYQAHYRLIFGQADDAYQPSAHAHEVAIKAFISLTKLVARLLPREATLAQQQDAALKVWSVIHGFVCLRFHTVGQFVDMTNWKERAMQTLIGVVADIERDAKPVNTGVSRKRENKSRA